MSFVENDVTGSDYTACLKIKAPVATMIRWIPEENTRCGVGTEFVRCRRSLIWKAQASEDTEVLVCGRCTKQTLETSHRTSRLAWPAIEKVSGCAQCLGPIFSRHAGMDEKGFDAVV